MADDKIKIAALEKELSAAKQIIVDKDAEIKKLQSSNESLAKEFETFKDVTKTQIEKIKNGAITIIEVLAFEFEGKKYRFNKAKFGVFGTKGMFEAKAIIKDVKANTELIQLILDKKMGIIEEITAETKERTETVIPKSETELRKTQK